MIRNLSALRQLVCDNTTLFISGLVCDREPFLGQSIADSLSVTETSDRIKLLNNKNIVFLTIFQSLEFQMKHPTETGVRLNADIPWVGWVC